MWDLKKLENMDLNIDWNISFNSICFSGTVTVYFLHSCSYRSKTKVLYQFLDGSWFLFFTEITCPHSIITFSINNKWRQIIFVQDLFFSICKLQDVTLNFIVYERCIHVQLKIHKSSIVFKIETHLIADISNTSNFREMCHDTSILSFFMPNFLKIQK